MKPLERGQLWVMRIHAFIAALFVLAAGSVGEAIVEAETSLPNGIVVVPLLILLVYPVLIGPARRYGAWGYAIDERELQVAHGVWTKMHTVVPLGRVQHIDVSQGPIERSFGVCQLVLHTAGTMHSKVTVPGLARATAEAMRDEIRARIRQESQ